MNAGKTGGFGKLVPTPSLAQVAVHESAETATLGNARGAGLAGACTGRGPLGQLDETTVTQGSIRAGLGPWSWTTSLVRTGWGEVDHVNTANGKSSPTVSKTQANNA